MKALIFAKSAPSRPMGQLMDRPFLQHVVEQLVKRGVDQVTVVLPAGETAATALLGDGTRWGVTIQRRYSQGEPEYRDLAASCPADSPELVLIGPADNLVFLPDLRESDVQPALFFASEGAVSRWSGWALLPEREAAAFVGNLSEENGWRDAARASGITFQKTFLDHASLSAASPRDLLLANRAVMEGGWPGLYFYGKEQQSGVWIGRGAKVHRSATLRAPCFIGENAWISANCTVGPQSVVASDSVVAEGTAVVRSVVTEGTYLGSGLDVSDCLVEANRIHNVRLNAEIQVPESHIASQLKSPRVPLWKRALAIPRRAASLS